MWRAPPTTTRTAHISLWTHRSNSNPFFANGVLVESAAIHHPAVSGGWGSHLRHRTLSAPGDVLVLISPSALRHGAAHDRLRRTTPPWMLPSVPGVTGTADLATDQQADDRNYCRSIYTITASRKTERPTTPSTMPTRAAVSPSCKPATLAFRTVRVPIAMAAREPTTGMNCTTPSTPNTAAIPPNRRTLSGVHSTGTRNTHADSVGPDGNEGKAHTHGSEGRDAGSDG